MKMKRTTEAVDCLKESINKLIYAHSQLMFIKLTNDERFEILWNLAFVGLQELEQYRLPGEQDDSNKTA